MMKKTTQIMFVLLVVLSLLAMPVVIAQDAGDTGTESDESVVEDTGDTEDTESEDAGVPYMHFLIPGIIMMPTITGAYMQTAFAVFLQKFTKSMEDITISPASGPFILAGFVLSGVMRGFILGILVLLVSLIFAPLQIFNIGYIFLFLGLTALLFSLIGFAAALHAKTFDDNNIIPTFGLTPLTYLGGVFYSISVLPEFWQTVSKFNPILYMVNGFRYGFLGISDVNVHLGVFILLAFVAVMVIYDLRLLRKGIGLRT